LICSIGTAAGAKDELKISGVEAVIKSTKGFYFADSIVGVIKFGGTDSCNFEKFKNKGLKYQGSYHTFIYDGSKLPAKGQPPRPKAKATASIMHSRARSMEAQQTNTTDTKNWVVWVQPAGFDATTSDCYVRDSTTDALAQTAPTKATTLASGCEVASNTKAAVVLRSLYILQKPAAPLAPAPKSASMKTTVSVLLLLLTTLLAIVM
jgi:hypothetical protein